MPAEVPNPPVPDSNARTPRATREDVEGLEATVEELKDRLTNERLALHTCRYQLRLAIADKYNIEDIAEKMHEG
jgi:hypothetical protein